MGNCEHCGGTGMVTVYHRYYEGSQMVTWEHTDRGGEVHAIRSAGTISAHCVCPKGVWMRENTDPELLPRIPDLADVLAGRTNYQATDPTDVMELAGPTEAAEAFLRRWKAGMPRYFPVEVP